MNLIKIKEHYIIVADYEKSYGDVVLFPNPPDNKSNPQSIGKVNGIGENTMTVDLDLNNPMNGNIILPKTWAKKVLFSTDPTHNLPSIDFSDLSIEYCKKIGWFDIKKIAQKAFNNWRTFRQEIGFVLGFQKCQEILSDKVFTLQEMVDFACAVYDENYKTDMSFKKRAEVMSTELIKTKWEVELEMELMHEHIDENNDLRNNKFQPKITNNSVKVLSIK